MKNLNVTRLLSLIFCAVIIYVAVMPCDGYAAKKVIGLVSEADYLEYYSNKNDYTAVPYYRYATRNKETTTSGYSSLSGWTQSGKTLISTSTGAWTTTAASSGTTNNSSYENVTTVATKKAYKYYTYVCNCKKWFWKNTGGAHGTCTTKNLLVVRSTRSTMGSKDSDGAYNASKSFSTSSPGTFSCIFGMWYNGNRITSWTSASNVTPMWRSSNVYTYYQSTVKKYRYSYWKWSDWSSWSDWTPNVRSTGDTCKKDSTVMYYVTDIRKYNQTISGKSTYNVVYGDSDFNLACSTNGDSVLKYTSSDYSVAYVNSDGTVNIVKPGTAVITVTAPATEDYYAAEKTITVNVSKKEQQITGKSSYSKTYGDGQFAVDASAQTALSYSSDNSNVADINASGLITVKGAGTANITVKAVETDKYKPATKKISIKINKANQNLNLPAGNTIKIDTNERSFNIEAYCETEKLSYKSSNTKIAIVSSKGKVTLKAPGNVKIYVTALSNGNYNSTKKTVNVKINLTSPIMKVSKVNNSEQKITFSWNKINCADGYEIKGYRDDKVMSKTTKSTKVTINNVKWGYNYRFKVRAYKVVNNKKVYSEYSNWIKIKAH